MIDLPGLLPALSEANVRFVVRSGMAVIVHSVARVTYNLSIVSTSGLPESIAAGDGIEGLIAVAS
jgi:hypothetical protein